MIDKLPEVLIIVALFAYSIISTLMWVNWKQIAHFAEDRYLRIYRQLEILRSEVKYNQEHNLIKK